MKNINNSKLKIIPLGGLEQIGMNITAFEFEDSIIVVDCGLSFPEDDMLGIDLVIPDVTYLKDNINKVKGFVITHGHEDHIGALPYVLREVNVPIYATKLTMGIIENKLKEHNLMRGTKRKVIKHGQSINLGCFRIEFIKTNHSIADAAALADYCLAFLGYGVDPDKADEAGRNAAYPYESIYRTGSKSLGGDHCAEVSDAFRACMFAPTRDRLIADDHIACELEFMQYLANSELTALRAGELAAAAGTRKKELEFLEGHLLAWIGSFGEAVAKFAETDFYTGLLAMTQGWLELDAEYLREVCATEREGAR